jgi:mRNA interferase RelE/StbE
MRYQVFIERQALKSLAKIPNDDRSAIEQKIRDLAGDPRPAGVKKLSGRDAWRIRIGNYRVIYEINDRKLIVLVVVIGHRKDVYRD